MSRKTSTTCRRAGAALFATALTIGVGAIALTPAAAAPTVTKVQTGFGKTLDTTPSGPHDGTGTSVVVVGTEFAATMTAKVYFGTVASPKFLVLDDKTLLADVPASGTSGAVDSIVDVTVATTAPSVAKDATVSGNEYEYGGAPSITTATYSVDGKKLLIAGTNLLEVNEVLLGTTKLSLPKGAVTDTLITTVVPSSLKGSKYDVIATSPFGSATADPKFRVRPAVTRLSSSAGSSLGGQLVVLTGSSLGDASLVTVGGVSADFIRNSETELVFAVPASTATIATAKDLKKKVDVVVTTPAGASKAASYEYRFLPTFTAQDISTAPAATATVVTITGGNLLGASVSFAGKTGSVVTTSSNNTTLVVKTPKITGTKPAAGKVVIKTSTGSVDGGSWTFS